MNVLQYDNAFKFSFAIYFSLSRLTPRSQTLIDNIFSNKTEVKSFSGDIATTMSDLYA